MQVRVVLGYVSVNLGILLDVYFHCTLFELLMGRHYNNRRGANQRVKPACVSFHGAIDGETEKPGPA